MEIANLIQSLSKPEAYPYPVETVEVRQTHLSVVFLAGSYVYKVKKPVRFDFVDFGTLEKRLYYCNEEVLLNRRLAPHVYVGTVPVVKREKGLHFEGQGEVFDWAVKMQRLPDDATLLTRLQRGEVSSSLIETLATRIARFHHHAITSERVAMSASYEAVADCIHAVLQRSEPQVGNTLDRGVRARLAALFDQTLRRCRHRIEARAASGIPRDAHGDLHLDHIYVFPDQSPPDDLVMIDCIEFNERLRHIDPVADMAFPVMDLLFHDRRDLARVFTQAYFREADDADGEMLLPLYVAYRAAVRGSVEGLLRAEQEVDPASREAAAHRARAYWLLALSELESPGRKPCLLLLSGLPGCGKSTLARKLAQVGNFQVLRSDAIRKELLASEPCEEKYSSEVNERTYTECLHRAWALLLQGKRVIVDATFRKEAQRRRFLDLAGTLGLPVILFHCQASPATVGRRLKHRLGDVSDADWNVYLKLAASFDPFTPTTRALCHAIDMEGNATRAQARAEAILRDRDLME